LFFTLTGKVYAEKTEKLADPNMFILVALPTFLHDKYVNMERD
jgi:hypothetical protein